jgi:2-polyprenyl-6-methoxyphenol hydroxylase-like FAD-dependent oxidoreductase
MFMSLFNAQRVLIAGGGIAGMAAWRAMRQQGIQSVVIERRSNAADEGLAINLPGNAIAALHRLGLGEAIERLGHPVRKREYRTRDDRLLAAIDEDAFWGETMRPRAVRRSDLLAMLGEGLDASALKAGSAIAKIYAEENAAHVRLDDGECLSGPLLVGADGVRSLVRQASVGASVATAARIASASWRFMAPNPGVDGWTLWTGECGMVLLLPVDDKAVYGWFTLSTPGVEANHLEAIREAFSDFPGRVREALHWALDHPQSIHHSPIEEVKVPRWTAERIVLIGDAAHATAPVWAQGGALAMEDALALAHLIAQSDDMSSLGRRFEALRRPRVAHVQSMTDRLSKAARLPYSLRKLIMPFVTPRSYRATYGPLKDMGF